MLLLTGPRQPQGSSRATSLRGSPAGQMMDDDVIADEDADEDEDDTLVELVGRDRADAMRSDDVIVKMAAQGGSDPQEMLDMQVR